MSEQAPSPFDEPLLETSEIQGNVLPGFMKPNMALIALKIGPDVNPVRQYLGKLRITTLEDVLQSRRRVRAARTLQPSDAKVGAIPDDLDDLWINVAISYQGLLRLAENYNQLKTQVESFTDEAFKLGMAKRSAALGDPNDPQSDGHASRWLVGGPENEADVLVVVAADRAETLARAIEEQTRAAEDNGLVVIHRDDGAKFDKIGSEHFGFQDGISQPGVRGRVSQYEFLDRRTLDTEPDRWLYGLPGQFLVWPGEFVFGYPAASADPLIPGAIRQDGPSWSRNGSYLVYRRLRQDVSGFWDFIAAKVAELKTRAGFEDWDDHRLAAALVGRWKSGAPLVRSPEHDDPELGRNRLANNLFGYAKASRPAIMLGDQTTGGSWPEALADPLGIVCPQAAHIRKVNSRETPNDMGASRASLDRRILRRGIPFGQILPTERGQADPEQGNRGLLFVSYQSSIERQFEFLNTRWMGSPVNPRSPSGHDLLVGQNGQPGEQRVRRAVLVGKWRDASQPPPTANVEMHQDFVIPTGGGYFFSPSISALRRTLGVT